MMEIGETLMQSMQVLQTYAPWELHHSRDTHRYVEWTDMASNHLFIFSLALPPSFPPSLPFTALVGSWLKCPLNIF